MSAPTVSVLMTMFDAAPHLRASVESILAQTFGDFEFVIVDDGSRDDSMAIVESYRDARIRLVRNDRNKGQTPCLNQGLALARGAWVARQDADDISLPRRLERQMARLRRDEKLALLGCQAWLVDDGGKFTGLLDVALGPESIEWAGLWENPFIHTAAIFRREVVARLGGYDESFRICQDYDLWMRVAAEHPVANLFERLVVYRHAAQSLQHSGRETVREESRRVLRRVVAQAFGEALGDGELDVLMRFREGVTAAGLAEFREVYASLLDRYAAAHPVVADTREFRRTCALHRAKIGRGVAAERPLAGLAELGRAFMLDPALLIHLAVERLTGARVLARQSSLGFSPNAARETLD